MKNSTYPFNTKELYGRISNVFEILDPIQLSPEIRTQAQKDAQVLKRAEDLLQKGVFFDDNANAISSSSLFKK
jgi:uncharacterized membrane protein YfbV (UPF0208 family)